MKDLEGSDIPSDAFHSIKVHGMTADVISAVYSAVLQILTLAFRMPPGSLKKDLFVKELTELK